MTIETTPYPAYGGPGVVRHCASTTCASLMVAAGFKPYEVSRWMGHVSVSTTDTIYGHLYPADYDDQIARFESFVAHA